MYHWTLYEYGYSMTNENLENFHIIKAIGDDEIGWTLGYMINQTNYLEPDSLPPRLLTKSEFGGLVVLCSVFLIISVIVAIITMIKFREYRDQFYEIK
jgi:hypothetical protein